MGGLTDESGRDWTALWGIAASSTVGHPPYEAVYTGPVWESASPTGPGSARVWKIAVLERRASGGAEHWGHLFVVLGENASKIAIHPEGGMQGDPDRPGLESLPASPGVPLQVLLRPRSAETSARLRAFALEFQRHAVALATD
ncbi:MAG: hypothetical protein WCB19_03400 [Thermoplasmata archaeon]